MRPRYRISLLISRLPFNSLRVFLYRGLYGYAIARSARIGYGSVIVANEVSMGDATVGVFNVFAGPFCLEIGDGAQIGSHNCIDCGRWVLESRFRDSGYARRCRVGANTLITGSHYIDAAGGFELGDGSWIAGRGSQFWTHGGGATDRSITIGSDDYIGSAARFTPGSGIANHSIVGIGSVVTKRFSQDYVMVAGVPAKVIKENFYFRERNSHAEPA